jgi:hypothetical protein
VTEVVVVPTWSEELVTKIAIEVEDTLELPLVEVAVEEEGLIEETGLHDPKFGRHPIPQNGLSESPLQAVNT